MPLPTCSAPTSGSCIRCSRRPAIRCDFIVDIGSAEGYFAVGLARLTKKPVIAFDVNGSERQIVREMAALNQVSHLVTISDWCSSARLMDLVSGKRALVFCDIDGGEFSLFTSDTVRALNLCDAFIELHGTPQENRGFIDRFVGREPIILDHPKESAGAERLALLGKDARRMSVEYRDPQQWLVLRPGDLSSLEQLREHLGSSASSLETTAARSRLQSEEVMLASSAGYIAGKTTTGRSASR